MSTSGASPQDGANRPELVRRSWKRLVQNLLGFLIVAGFALYLWENRDELGSALDASAAHIGALCVLVLLSWFVSGLQAVVVYRALSVRISVREGFMLTVAGTFGNYLPMRAGTVVRALYMKRVHGVGYARFGGITGLRTLLNVIAAGLVGTAGLIAIWAEGESGPGLLLVSVFVGFMIAPILVMLIPAPRWEWLPQRLNRVAGDFTSAYDELRRQPVVAIQVVALLAAQYLILSVRFLVSANALGYEVALALLLLAAPLAALTSFAALTPGGLGLREAIMGYVTLTVGYSFSEGVFIGTVDRAVLLVMLAVVGGLIFLMLWRRIARVDTQAAQAS
jgi:uncharacterized membrane protein YbhN (UPF0104 family)